MFVHISSNNLATEDNKTIRLDYCVTRTDGEKQYGIMITAAVQNGDHISEEYSSIENGLFFTEEEAAAFARRLSELTVTPVTLRDMIDDYM